MVWVAPFLSDEGGGTSIDFWMLKEAVQGPTTAKVLFVANLLMVWLLAILAFGYPAIIIPALVPVPAMFVVLLLITKG